MSVDGMFPWLAQGPFVVFAIIIGVVVSLDVAVVEITRDYEKEDRNGKSRLWTSRMRTMLILHALFHSVSFFVYMIFIWVAQYLMFLPIEFFDLPEDIGIGLLTLINFFIVMFIWWTYKSKVKEDHSEKTDDSEAVDRKDMKLFVDFVRWVSDKKEWGDKVRGVAVAGSVAVDMLAVSALLKGVLLPNGGEAPIASMFGKQYPDCVLALFLDLFIFALFIFGVVAIVVFVAQMLGKLAREFHCLVFGLRVFEPFAVFFILAGVARLLAGLFFESLPTVYTVYGDLIDASFAVVVTFSLLWYNGIRWQNLKELYARRSEDQKSDNPPSNEKKLKDDFKGVCSAISIIVTTLVVVFILMLIAYSTDPGREPHYALVEATSYIAGLVVIFTILFLYAPLKRLDDWETSGTNNLSDKLLATPKEYFNQLGAVTLALLALNIHTFLMLGRTFVLCAIATWSMYVLLSWLFFDLRRWRFCKSNRAGKTCRTNYADFAELVTTVGLASALVVIFAPVLALVV